MSRHGGLPGESFSVYHKLPNVSTWNFKQILRGLYQGGHIFGGHYVLVSAYYDKKLSLSLNHLYFALKPT